MTVDENIPETGYQTYNIIANNCDPKNEPCDAYQSKSENCVNQDILEKTVVYDLFTNEMQTASSTVQSNIRRDELMTDNLNATSCSVENVRLVTDVSKNDETVFKSLELSNCLDNFDNERLKELDAYLTALENIVKEPQKKCNTVGKHFLFLHRYIA